MADNLYNSDHKSTNPSYRDNYDRTFKTCSKCKGMGEVMLDRGAWVKCSCQHDLDVIRSQYLY